MLCRTMGGPSYSFTVHGPEEFDKATVLALAEKINYADLLSRSAPLDKVNFIAGVSTSSGSKSMLFAVV